MIESLSAAGTKILDEVESLDIERTLEVGRREKASALPLAVPFLYCISKSYAWR